MDINARLSRFYDWYTGVYQMSQKEFAEAVGLSPSQLSSIIKGRDKVGLIIVEKFLNFHPDIDANWLITGRGSMLKEEIQEIEVKPVDNAFLLDRIEKLAVENSELRKEIESLKNDTKKPANIVTYSTESQELKVAEPNPIIKK